MKDFKPPTGKNYGYWIDSDKENFDNSIKDIYNQDHNKREEFTINARSYFEKDFSRNKSLKKLLEIYNNN